MRAALRGGTAALRAGRATLRVGRVAFRAGGLPVFATLMSITVSSAPGEPRPAASISMSADQSTRAERMRVEVVTSYPHDRRAFTQGLLLENGKLFESTGLVGQSSLREVEVKTGRVIRRVSVPPPLFAEGLAMNGNQLIQLTWQSGRALIYDKRTFTRAGEFSYRGEGWGLCNNGGELVMSNGSADLTFRNPKDFSVVRTLTVTLDGQRLDELNELECVGSDVYANVWMRDLIVRIDTKTGQVKERIDAPNLLSPLERQGVDVMNGIAYDPSDRTFLITGKLWPRMFRVRFVKAE